MVIDLITREDLNEFRNLLLNNLKQLIRPQSQQAKQWLKSYEVRKLLNISADTLQIYGSIARSLLLKLAVLCITKYSDIEKVMNSK